MNDIKLALEKFGVLDRVPVGMCVLREDFVVLFWNSCLEDWTKIPRSEILGTNIIGHFPHLNQPKYSSRLKQIFEGGPPTIFSSQLHKYIIPAEISSGQLRIQQTTVTAVPTVNGVGFYALLAIQDVTDLTSRLQDYRKMRDQALEEIQERQRVEEALRESQHFIQQIADTAPHLTYIYDLSEQRNVYMNSQIGELLGYTLEEITEMGAGLLPNLMHPDDFAHLRRHQEKFAAARDGEIIECDYRMKHKGGEWRWLHSRELVFSRTAEGVPKQILGTAQDITDRKRTEEALRWQTERERLMGVITQHIRQSLNLREILHTTVTEVREFLQTDRVSVLRFNPDWSGVVTVESVVADVTPMLGASIYDPYFEETYIESSKHDRILVVEDIYSAGLCPNHINLLEEFGVRSKLVVPIIQGEQTIHNGQSKRHHPQLWGLLIAHHCSRDRRWQQLEIDLLKQLANQVAIAIQQAELYQQLEAANQELKRIATLDSLTGLANRRRFDEYLDVEWRRMRREQMPLSLILCDIDCFKTYNDTYGHQAGDECLRQVARALNRGAKRPADLVARYGGEEFALVLPYTDAPGAIRVAIKILVRVRALQIAHTASLVSEYVTVSLGVASTIPRQDSSPTMLIAAADEALYQAKAAGRNRVQVYADPDWQLHKPAPPNAIAMGYQ